MAGAARRLPPLDGARHPDLPRSTTRTRSRCAFWEWLIAELRKVDPGVIFLAEAFTKPAMMHELAKVGMNQ